MCEIKEYEEVIYRAKLYQQMLVSIFLYENWNVRLNMCSFYNSVIETEADSSHKNNFTKIIFSLYHNKVYLLGPKLVKSKSSYRRSASINFFFLFFTYLYNPEKSDYWSFLDFKF